MEPESITLYFTNAILSIELLPFTAVAGVAIFINFILLLFSALISGSEVAYFSLAPQELNEIKAHHTKTNKLIIKHLQNKEQLLATILISNNFVNVAIVIITSFAANELISFGNNDTLRFIFEIIGISSLLLFFGEILPKVYSSQIPKQFASFMAYPLMVLSKVLNPLSSILIKSTDVVNNRIKKNIGNLSMDDISQALELTVNDITEEKDILEGIVKFGNINVSEIMTSRVDVIDVALKSDFNKVLQTIIESGYSRIPVFEETPDNVKGILYVKDLLPHLSEGANYAWQVLIRSAYYVPETKMINDLLTEFQHQKIHMAIVVDEYGGTSGVVTLEDILEEIVGDISDELDDEEIAYTTLPDGSYVFEGKTLLNDFHKITDTDEVIFEKVRGEAETLAGLILEINGKIPLKNEVIILNDIKFTVLAADNRRIKKVKYTPKNIRA